MTTNENSAGDPGSRETIEVLFPRLYSEIRALAAASLKRERVNHTLQPTALANEVYAKIAATDRGAALERSQFMAMACVVIREVLIDHARTKNRQKRGGGVAPVALDAVDAPAHDDPFMELIEVDEALTRLSADYERCGKVVQMRFYGGMTEREVAQCLGVAESTVSADWKFARAWLKSRLKPATDAAAFGEPGAEPRRP